MNVNLPSLRVVNEKQQIVDGLVLTKPTKSGAVSLALQNKKEFTAAAMEANKLAIIKGEETVVLTKSQATKLFETYRQETSLAFGERLGQRLIKGDLRVAKVTQGSAGFISGLTFVKPADTIAVKQEKSVTDAALAWGLTREQVDAALALAKANATAAAKNQKDNTHDIESSPAASTEGVAVPTSEVAQPAEAAAV